MTMSTTQFVYSVRARNSTWGIYIDLTASMELLLTSHVNMLPVFPNLWLSMEAKNPRLLPEEGPFLVQGLKLVEKELESRLDRRVPTVIRIIKVVYSLCDYQSEGLACAIAGWAGQHFGFDVPDVPFEFDKPMKRYVFHFDRVQSESVTLPTEGQ